MNMLLDRVPNTLTVAGTRYPVYTDYRVWIRFEKLLTEESGSNSEMLEQILSLVFKESPPPPAYAEETVDQILWFYKCGKDSGSKSGSGGKDVFSYDYDDGYIAAAFKQQYGINLSTEELHWWEFHAYMLALSGDTEFVKIMGYRAVDVSPKMSSAERSFYQKMKQHYKLPVKKELQEQYDQLEEALLNGEPIDGLL